MRNSFFPHSFFANESVAPPRFLPLPKPTPHVAATRQRSAEAKAERRELPETNNWFVHGVREVFGPPPSPPRADGASRLRGGGEGHCVGGVFGHPPLNEFVQQLRIGKMLEKALPKN